MSKFLTKIVYLIFFNRRFHRRKNAVEAEEICRHTEMNLASFEDAKIFEGQKRLSKAFQWSREDIRQKTNCDFENIFDEIEVQINNKNKIDDVIETR